ncbi:hypothetical protein CR513_25169, partial [Mucuna pruriens]
MEHPIDMCSTLQETKPDSAECVGAIAILGATILAEFESRALYSSEIRINQEHASFKSEQLSTTDSKISGTIIPLATTTIVPPQENPPSMEEWMKFQQNLNAMMQDLKMQVGQLADTMSQMQSSGIVTLQSGRELQHQSTLQPNLRLISAESELEADSQVQQQARVPLHFPTRTVPTRRFEIDEDLLKLFRKVEINIPLFDAIK